MAVGAALVSLGALAQPANASQTPVQTPIIIGDDGDGRGGGGGGGGSRGGGGGGGHDDEGQSWWRSGYSRGMPGWDWNWWDRPGRHERFRFCFWWLREHWRTYRWDSAWERRITRFCLWYINNHFGWQGGGGGHGGGGGWGGGPASPR
jgi:hypothetical protein